MARLLSGMKPLDEIIGDGMPPGRTEESQESRAWRQRRKETKPRFYFQREHDVHLYMFVLDANEWDEEKDDLRYDWRGNCVMTGGWKGVAARMNATFGTELNELQVKARMKLLESKDDEFHLLFDETMNLRDAVEEGRMRLLSVLQARVPTDKVEDGLVEYEVIEAGRPAGDRNPALPEP